MKKVFLISLVVCVCLVILGCVNSLSKSQDIKASYIPKPSAVVADLVLPTQATEKKFNILVIPGHDVNDGGAKYKNIYERDLTTIIASEISVILGKEGKYNVIVARDTEKWNPILAEYFQNKKQEIIDWKNMRQSDEKAALSSGEKKYVPDAGFHSDVSTEMSVKLYGMNKWANENNIDLVLNLHFNDEYRPNMNVPGDLKGFAIFIPESQFKNSATSRIIAQSIFNRLEKIEPPEINKLLEDQSLIALGASGTLNPPSMLIEYSYIYEKMLRTAVSQSDALSQMAEQTALGAEDYFNKLNQ